MPRTGHRGAIPPRARRPALRWLPQRSWRTTPRLWTVVRVFILAPDGRPEGPLVREPAGPRVACQVIRHRRAAPLSEIPLDGSLPIGSCPRPPVVVQLSLGPGHQLRVLPPQPQIVEEMAERVPFGLPAGPAHHLLGDDEPLEVLCRQVAVGQEPRQLGVLS